MRRDGMGKGERTNALVHHVNFEREVLAVDAVLGRGVNVELSKSELVATKGGGAVDDNLDGGVEVLKFHGLLWDVQDRLLSSEAHRAVYVCVSGALLQIPQIERAYRC